MIGYNAIAEGCGVVRSGEERGIRFEIVTPEEFDKRYQRYKSLWQSDECIEAVGHYTIDAVLLWGAGVKYRGIVIEDQKDEWKYEWEYVKKCRYIMWWLGYCILGKCTTVEKERPEWLYDDVTFSLCHRYNDFGLLPMKWELRDKCDEGTIIDRKGSKKYLRHRFERLTLGGLPIHVIQLEGNGEMNVEILANNEKVYHINLSPFRKGKIVLLEVKEAEGD